eukprot:52640-Prorocentrum_minimum.AAC.4
MQPAAPTQRVAAQRDFSNPWSSLTNQRPGKSLHSGQSELRIVSRELPLDMWRSRCLRMLGGASLGFAGTGAVLAEASRETDWRAEIAKLRPEEPHFRAKWIQDEEGWHKLPARAWPAFQPKVDQIPALRALFAECSKDETLSEECRKHAFNLGTALVFNMVDPPAGLDLYSTLAKLGDLDGIVGTGVVLIGGHGVEYNTGEGVQWLRKASAKGHAQGHYELAICFYTGDGEVEDETRAFHLFQKAADLGHMGGMFMVGDCLREGVGCERDEAQAIRWLFAAAQQGHRQSRCQILKYLDAER